MITRNIPIFAVIILLANISQADDARLSGMGNLNFVFQDDFNRLNLYDFAKMPAGFFTDDSFSMVSFTAAGLKEKWQMDSIAYLTYWALGQAFPENLKGYAPFEALGAFGFADIPQFNLPPCQLRYEARRMHSAYGSFGEKLGPEALGVYGSYSQLSREYTVFETSDVIRTPEFFVVYSKPVLNNLFFGAEADGFYSRYRAAGNGEEADLKPFGGGLGISYTSGMFTLGLNSEYHYSIFDFRDTFFGGEYSQTFRGHAVSPSIAGIMSTKKFTWINVFSYKWLSLSGTQDSETELGDLGMNDYLAKSQILFQQRFFRFTIFGSFDTKTPEFIDNNGNTEFRTTYNNYTGVFGCGVDLPRVRAGIEGQYINNSANDKIQDTIIKGNDLTLKIGGEFSLTKDFLFRCGYNNNRADPNSDASDDRVTSNLLTYGLGFNFVRQMRLDLAYNHKWFSFENNVDEKVTDQILLLYIKYFM